MEIMVFLFPQLNFSAQKEEPYFKMLSPSDCPVIKKENKTRVKEREKKNRLSLLLSKSGSHENVNPQSMKSPTTASIISPEEALKWSDSFEKLLANKDGLDTFTTFLKSQFSEENIEFWLACEDFKKNKSTKLASKAKKIYSVYIETEAPKEVNIDFSTSQIIKQNVQNPTQSCFDTAQSIIYSLMKKDCYPRFLKSDIYLNLIQKKPPSNNMIRRRSRSCVFNDRIEAETDFGIWL
ncbi:regulator of G-protein signaling 21 [Huso huso]|uniref:Regulator of G-protein signaling 21 n=1 Tax=Huso huso TaxID=61971 RepID=A0ABR0ZJ09_HUSHU|nr:regulator of G-protein signaling 18 [Acipenser ruthenus]